MANSNDRNLKKILVLQNSFILMNRYLILGKLVIP